MRLLIIVSILFISALGNAQSRDTLVTKTLRYLNTQIGEGVVDTQTVWSDNLTDYIEYSRINMGSRMNEGIRYNKVANNQFGGACMLSLMATVTFITASYSDPVIYIEGHNKYNREYYNDARKNRNFLITMGGTMAAGAVYLFWRSNRNYKRSKWHISPNGIKYNF